MPASTEDSDRTAADSAPLPAEWAGPAVSLDDCEGEPQSFETLAAARGLLVAIGAAWCGPCQDDAPNLESYSVANPDVGVVQVLVQDASGAPATHLACEEWTEAFSLTHPVLIDPVFVTDAIAGDQGFPVHVAYSAVGEQLYWQAGAFDEAAVTAALSAGVP